MVKVEVFGRIIGNNSKAYDADDVDEIDDKDPKRQIPSLSSVISGISNNENSKEAHERNAIAGAADPDTAGTVDPKNLEVVHLPAGKGLKTEKIQDALAAIENEADEHLVYCGIALHNKLIYNIACCI